MAMYNMVGCNTSRTHSGGVKVRAGQFRGYGGHVKINNTTQINETIIFTGNRNSCCSSFANYCAPPHCSGGGGGLAGILTAVAQFVPLLGMLFGGKEKAEEADGQGSPKGNDDVGDAVKKETVQKKPEKTIEETVDPKTSDDVYAATITSETIKEQDVTHTVKRGECWYDVLDAKYPGIPSSDRKGAIRALKRANGMTDPNSADMPRKMVLPQELKVGDNVYKLNNDGVVKGSVTQFTQGGMYDAKISERESTTYTVSGTKNGKNEYNAKFTQRAEAEAAKQQWEKKNSSE